MQRKSTSHNKKEAPKCEVCGQTYKHYKIFPSKKMIKQICNCNQNLLDIEAEKINQKYLNKMNSPDYKGVKILEFKG